MTCPEPQPLGFSGLSKKKREGWEKASISASHVSPRNRRRNLTGRDLRRPLKYFMSNEWFTGFFLCNRYAVVIFCLLLKPAAGLHTLDSKAYLRRTFDQPIPGPFPDPLVF